MSASTMMAFALALTLTVGVGLVSARTNQTQSLSRYLSNQQDGIGGRPVRKKFPMR